MKWADLGRPISAQHRGTSGAIQKHKELSVINGGRCFAIDVNGFTSAFKHGKSNVFMFNCYSNMVVKRLLVFLVTVTLSQHLMQTVLTSSPAMFWCYLQTTFLGSELVLWVSKDKELT